MKREIALHLDVLVYKEDIWIAHCLQLDLVTTADSDDKAIADMRDVIKAHIEFAAQNDNWEHLFKPAPPEVWAQIFELQRKGARPKVEITEIQLPAYKYLPGRNVAIQSLSYAA